jgi:hypothetical protein
MEVVVVVAVILVDLRLIPDLAVIFYNFAHTLQIRGPHSTLISFRFAYTTLKHENTIIWVFGLPLISTIGAAT